jgi:hypothetical protein
MFRAFVSPSLFGGGGDVCVLLYPKNVKCKSRVFRAHPGILSLEHKCHSLPYSSYVVEEVSLNKITKMGSECVHTSLDRDEAF